MAERKDYVVGVEQLPDGTVDYSHAATLRPIIEGEVSNETSSVRNDIKDTLGGNVLSKEELGSIYLQLKYLNGLHKRIRIGQIAKSKSVTPEQIFQELNTYRKFVIREKEKGNIRHFHRTSIKNFKSIAEVGRLLSRTKLKEIKPGINIPMWSSSDNIMMTRDKYDTNGNMIEPGFHEQEVVGASGTGVVLVFRDDIIDKEDYDATGVYPTAGELSLSEYCEVILVDSEKDLQEVEQILLQNNLKIPVALKTEWQREP